MLIHLEVLVQKYGFPKGIIHIGAHHLQEREVYKKHNLTNTIWIEANPKIVEYVQSTIRLWDNEFIYNFAATDTNDEEILLNITSFDQSSSILKLGTHKKYYPQINVAEITSVKAKRMDNFIEEVNLDLSKYNFLNLDIQGAELKALKGFGKYINCFDYIYTEVNQESLYEDCCLLPELDLFLDQNGYKRVEICMTPANWGDAFYIKK